MNARLDLPWTSPPLSLNDRGYTRGAAMARASKVRELRETAFVLAHEAGLPKGLVHVTVQLHYQPRDNKHRDPINLAPVQKALVDGLRSGNAKYRGYGLVADDDPRYLTDLMPAIHPAVKGEGGRMWLELSWIAEDAA